MTETFSRRHRPSLRFGVGGRSRQIGRRPEARSESERIQVALARFIGVGYVIYALIVVPELVSEGVGRVPAWYPTIGAALCFGPGVALLVVALVPRWHRRVPVAALTCPLGLAIGGALWILVATPGSGESAFWMLNFAGLAPMATILVLPAPAALAVVVAAKSLGAAVAVAHVPNADVSGAVSEALFGVFFSGVFVLLAGQVIHIGAALDRSRADAERAVARGVRNVELARVDALIHDHVLSTLVAAAADPADPRIAAQAVTALAALDGLTTDDEASATVSATEAVARLRAVISGVDADAPVTVEVAEAVVACPVEVVTALAEATAESLRNSRAHAGPDADRAVFIGIRPGSVQLVVADDGVGFDPAAVPADRLGLALSISDRVGSLDGGQVIVRSAPGAGAVIRLSWRDRNVPEDSDAEARS